MVPDDPRKHAPSAQRNRGPILDVLRGLVPQSGTWLEVASGSGEHTAHFAAAFPAIRFQPTDFDPQALPSIDAWAADARLSNVEPAQVLDAAADAWAVGEFDVIYNANMIHISPWACCLGLLSGAARHLRAEGMLITYGPYRIDGAHTAPSNEAFDASLRQRDSSWGVRDLEAVTAAARAQGLVLAARHEMPANNQLLVLRRG